VDVWTNESEAKQDRRGKEETNGYEFMLGGPSRVGFDLTLFQHAV